MIAANFRFAPVCRRYSFALVLASATLAHPFSQAWAVDDAVARACMSDYLAYCSMHDPNGSEVRKCMRAAGLKLSVRCVMALVSAGEVSKSEVARQSASRR